MIFIDTNIVSETMRRHPHPPVMEWLERHDRGIAVSTVVIAEVAFGIEKVALDQRAARFGATLDELRQRHATRIFALTEDAALICGRIMGAASRRGRAMSTADGMIAAIALVNGGSLATRNLKHFETTGLELVSPWDY